MLDKLAKVESQTDKNIGDFQTCLQHFDKSLFFLLENTLYVLKDEFIHPGGQFILPRIHRGHITKYYYGISPMKNMPYPNMVYIHSSPIPSELCKQKINIPTSTLWVKKHSNLLMTTSTWKNDYSWRVLKVKQLSKEHVMFHVRPKNVMIEIDEIENSISNFGKILLCQLKHQHDFKYSFLHLSSYDVLVNNRKKFYNTILHKSAIPVFQKVTTRSQGVLINFNKKRKLDVMQSAIQNKFAKKYFNEIFDEVTENLPNMDYLPIILKLKDRKKFLDGLSRAESKKIKDEFVKKSDDLVELTSKMKFSLGGPFGYDNILEEGKETVIFVDNDGIYALDDTAYGLLNSMYIVLTSSDRQEIEKHEKRLSMGLHIIFKTSVDKMDTLTEFLVAFYFFEQTTKKGFLRSLFVFTNEALLKDYIAENHTYLAAAHRHIICAKYKNAYMYFKQIKKLVLTQKLMFI